MARKDEKITAPVEKERAMQHALMTARRAWAGGVRDFEAWGTVELEPTPLVIYDLNGDPLFFEFTAIRSDKPMGRLKTSATKRIGVTVPTVEFGARPWSPEKGTAEAKKNLKKMFPQATIDSTQLVCYSYPKIGVRVDVRDKKTGIQSYVFDVADGTLITRFGADELEGQTAWSFLDAITPSQAAERIRSWEINDAELEAAKERTPKLFARGLTTKDALNIRTSLVVPSHYIPIPFYSSKVIKFSPRCDTHNCFELYAQQTSYNCAVATGQMILDFYRYYYDQDDIAAAMGTTASGTTNPGQVTGYESLSYNCLTATFDNSADWYEAKAEININRPVKSGVPGHARACAGWKRQNVFIIGQPRKRWLKIYDPWPWNSDICAGGQVYWEDWDTVTHTNFIYIRHRTTVCI